MFQYFVQGSEAYLNAGDFMETPDLTFDIDTRSDVTNNNQNIGDVCPSTDETDSVVKPLVDLSELEDATQKTVEILNDPAISLNPHAVFKTLTDWVMVLNKTFHRLHIKKFRPDIDDSVSMSDSRTSEGSALDDMNKVLTETDEKVDDIDKNKSTENNESSVTMQCTGEREQGLDCAIGEILTPLTAPDFCYVKDPLCLPNELLKTVKELAQACFDTGCHGNIMQFQKIDKQDIVTDKRNNNMNNTNEDVGELNIEKSKQNGAKEELEHFDIKNNDFDNDGKDSNCVCDDIVESKSENCDRKKSTDFHKCDKIDNIRNDIKDTLGTDNVTQKTNNSACSVYNEEEERKRCVEGSMSNSSVNRSSQAEEWKDNSIGFFVRCYFPYLKPVRVREAILSGKFEYQTWCGMLTGMEGKFTKTVRKLPCIQCVLRSQLGLN